ncbi:kelch-like protein 25 [Glandiceps talaboti]
MSGTVSYRTLYVPDIATRVLSSLDALRRRDDDIDTILCVDDEELPCHRVVLSACSPYFKAMFAHELKESSDARVTLNDVKPDVIKPLIDFAYTMRLDINEENVQDLLTTANFLQFDDVTSACCDFMTNKLTPENCLGIWEFAENLGCKCLAQSAKSYSLANFDKVSAQTEFLQMEKKVLIAYIQDDRLQCTDEIKVCQAVLEWLKFDQANRADDLTDILEHVRLPLANIDTSTTELLENEPYKRFLDEAKYCQQLMQKGYKIQGPRTRLRRGDLNSEFLILLGGQTKDEYKTDAEFNAKVMYTPVSESIEHSQWRELAQMPNPKKRKLSILHSGVNIYVVGGYDSVIQRSSAEVWSYNFTANYWKRLKSLNTARHSHGSALLHRDIFVAGGKNSLVGMRLSSAERYSAIKDEWTNLPSMPEAVSVPSVVACRAQFFVIGGSNINDMPCNKIQCYDTLTKSWSIVRHISIQRKLLTSAVVENKIYIFGGKCPRDVIIYDPKSKTVIYERHASNEQRLYPGVMQREGKIYLTGGKGTDQINRCTDIYDTNTNSWSRIMDFLPVPLYMHGGCIIKEV